MTKQMTKKKTDTAVTKLPSKLTQLEGKIKKLMNSVAMNAIELGKTLREARAQFPVKGRVNDWSRWLSDRFSMHRNRAQVLIKLADRFENNANISGNKVSATVLEVLLLSDVTQEIEDDVLSANDRSIRETGKSLTNAKARAIVKAKLRKKRGLPEEEEPKLPTASQARKMAQEARDRGEMLLVAARDGNYYTGATDEEDAAYAKIRNTVYGLQEAVEFLAKLEVTPHEMATNYAYEHQRWWLDSKAHTGGLARVLEAASWLQAFATALERST